jgi:NADH-quinone oxidoreductase subunit F
MALHSAADLEALKKQIEHDKTKLAKTTRVIVHEGTCGFASGAAEILEALKKAKDARDLQHVVILEHSCIGCCYIEPYIGVIDPDGRHTIYGYLDPEKVNDIVEKHLIGGEIAADHAIDTNIPFFTRQEKRITGLLGKIDPFKIDDYILYDGYQALSKTLAMKQEDVLEEIKSSGLRGRGGAGFPTGLKWNFAYQAQADQKYIVCNADEGDPGAYMNRAELEGNPHAVLEGMAIGGYAIGANKGYIYVRAEYPLAVETLEKAIAQAKEHGLLGKSILGSSFDFDIELFLGSGAFVCGEETALLTSLEQKRGTPRPRPPFPAQKGLFGKPTVLNNVGTLSNVPLIIHKGATWWSSIGSENTKGTKVFSLTGQIQRPGLIEVPMGISVGEVVFDIGGGVPGNKHFKAVQLGGPSGGCVPAKHLNMPIDYESLKEIDCIMGSGAMVILDEDACMVDTAKFFLEFDRDESCGQCLPCRRGLPLMIEILERIVQGRGEIEDLNHLKSLATTVKKTALCALGQTAASPTLSTLRHFRNEYEAHIIQQRCPAGVCASLFDTRCRNACPIHQDIPAYMALTKEGQIKEAYQVIKQTNPIPLVLGRVCHHPCEGKCERQMLDEALAIREVKRFVADWAYHNGVTYTPPLKKKRDESVAIVGSGPAGLGAAYDLAIEGFAVTIYDALPVAGGMLAVGIPEYRLPMEVLEYEIDQIHKMGIDICLNTRIDSLDQLFAQGHQAVFLAIGAHGERRMNIPGEDLLGVYMGTQFLRQLQSGQQPDLGHDVVVIGGGNSAVDCARVARRLGSEVRLVYRREKCDMPAIWEDIQAAEEEGIVIDCLTQPVAFHGDDRVQTVECQKMSLGEYDASCRRKPCQIEDAGFVIKADTVIESIGQFPKSDQLLRSGVPTQDNGRLTADPYTLQTELRGVFAGGDAVTGPLTVVDAVAAGQRAACSIRHYLNKEALSPILDRKTPERYHVPFAPDEEPREQPKVQIKEREPAERIKGFEEVVFTYSLQEAQDEAGRCLRCDGR